MTELSHRPRSPFSVASYNIHCCVGTDGRHDADRVLEVVQALDCDIIALQEVDNDGQLSFLARELRMIAVPGPNLRDHRGEYGNGLLSRFPISLVRLQDLSVHHFEPRGAIDAELEVAGQRVRIVATHLGLRRHERLTQVKRLLHALHVPGSEDIPLVVAGDFNEWQPGSRVLRHLHRRFGGSIAPRTFPSRFPLLALDRIWVWPPDGLRRMSVYATPLTRQASDHLPVRAEVSWEPHDLPGAWRERLSIDRPQ